MSSLITQLISKSPLKPLQTHMEKSYACVALLKDFLEAASEQNWERAAELQAAIKQAENDADAMKEDIRKNLPTSLLMPFARADLLALVTIQDRLANKAKDIAGRMLGRRMEIPPSIGTEFKAYFETSIEAARIAKAAIEQLDDLFEFGFAEKNVELVENLVSNLAIEEERNDQQQIMLRAGLMEIEDSLPPVKVMFLYQVIEMVGDMADVAQRIGHRLTLLLTK